MALLTVNRAILALLAKLPSLAPPLRKKKPILIKISLRFFMHGSTVVMFYNVADIETRVHRCKFLYYWQIQQLLISTIQLVNTCKGKATFDFYLVLHNVVCLFRTVLCFPVRAQGPCAGKSQGPGWTVWGGSVSCHLVAHSRVALGWLGTGPLPHSEIQWLVKCCSYFVCDRFLHGYQNILVIVCFNKYYSFFTGQLRVVSHCQGLWSILSVDLLGMICIEAAQALFLSKLLGSWSGKSGGPHFQQIGRLWIHTLLLLEEGAGRLDTPVSSCSAVHTLQTVSRQTRQTCLWNSCAKAGKRIKVVDALRSRVACS